MQVTEVERERERERESDRVGAGLREPVVVQQ